MTSERDALDGNAIAADRHYDGPPRECSICGQPFGLAEWDEAPKHPRFVDLCTDCGEDMEDAHD